MLSELPCLYILHISSFVQTDIVFAHLYSVLSPVKRDRIASLRQVEDRGRALYAELLARISLAHLLNIKYYNIEFNIEAGGKPILMAGGVHSRVLHFNLSHSQDAVALLIDTAPVGIDIEFIQPLDFKEDNSCRMFMNQQELLTFNQITTISGKINYFYTVWTIKESMMKYNGMGLTMDPLELDTGHIISAVARADNDTNILWRGRYPAWNGKCYIDSYTYYTQYLLATCTEKTVNPTLIRLYSDDIISILNKG